MTKIYIAEALVEDAELHYVDDNDPVETKSFLGAHDSPEKAMAFLYQVANAERQAENDLIDECETGEAHMPELALAFSSVRADHGAGVRRTTWTSDAVEFANRGMVVRYRVTESRLNPVL